MNKKSKSAKTCAFYVYLLLELNHKKIFRESFLVEGSTIDVMHKSKMLPIFENVIDSAKGDLKRHVSSRIFDGSQLYRFSGIFAIFFPFAQSEIKPTGLSFWIALLLYGYIMLSFGECVYVSIPSFVSERLTKVLAYKCMINAI